MEASAIDPEASDRTTGLLRETKIRVGQRDEAGARSARRFDATGQGSMIPNQEILTYYTSLSPHCPALRTAAPSPSPLQPAAPSGCPHLRGRPPAGSCQPGRTPSPAERRSPRFARDRINVRGCRACAALEVPGSEWSLEPLLSRPRIACMEQSCPTLRNEIPASLAVSEPPAEARWSPSVSPACEPAASVFDYRAH